LKKNIKELEKKSRKDFMQEQKLEVSPKEELERRYKPGPKI
jgi:hypothetical protein